jgi:hypothetical protein
MQAFSSGCRRISAEPPERHRFEKTAEFCSKRLKVLEN